MKNSQPIHAPAAGHPRSPSTPLEISGQSPSPGPKGVPPDALRGEISALGFPLCPGVHRKLKKDAAFRTWYRAQAIAAIQRGSIASGLAGLEILAQSMADRYSLHFPPDLLRLWTTATKYRGGKIHDQIEASMVLLFREIIADRVRRGKKVPPEMAQYVALHTGAGKNSP